MKHKCTTLVLNDPTESYWVSVILYSGLKVFLHNFIMLLCCFKKKEADFYKNLVLLLEQQKKDISPFI